MEHFYFNILFFVPLIILCFFVTIISKQKSKYKHANLPPGNLGLPFLGESLNFLRAGWKGHPEKFIFDRIAKYSTHIFKTNIFLQPTAVVCGAAANKFLFSNENKLVVVWWPDFVKKIFPSSVRSSTIVETKRMRIVLPPFLKPEALQRYIGIMDTIAQRHFSSEWENKQEVLVFPLTKSYMLTLACRLFLSIEDPNYIARFGNEFNYVKSGVFCIPIDFPGTSFNRAIKASKFIRNEILNIINKRNKDLVEGKATASQDLLSHMLLTCDEDGQYRTEFEIADQVLALLMTGHDSASTTCAFVVKYLAELPHIYEGVYKEQMEIAKSKLPGELLNGNDIQKMKYSWNVACEVLRLLPPLLGTFREATKDFNFSGFNIPKGWKLYWSTTSTHKNPEYFHEPEKFDPSRFEGKGPAPYTFVPFGGGPRMCPGKEFARFEILVFMHNLVKRFKLDKVILDEKIVYDPVPIPTKGLPIRLHHLKAQIRGED